MAPRTTLKACFTATLLCGAMLESAAANPAARSTSDFERPYGFGYGQETQPFDAGTRDINGNRLIVDGQFVIGDDLSTLSTSTGLSQSGFGNTADGTSTAGAGFSFNGPANVFGNQLNVITQGNNNTVIVDSTQINEGDQTVILNGGVSLNAN